MERQSTIQVCDSCKFVDGTWECGRTRLELEGKWILCHSNQGYLGRLVLQTKDHRASLSVLGTNIEGGERHSQADWLGRHLAAIEEVMRDYWPDRFHRRSSTSMCMHFKSHRASTCTSTSSRGRGVSNRSVGGRLLGCGAWERSSDACFPMNTYTRPAMRTVSQRPMPSSLPSERDSRMPRWGGTRSGCTYTQEMRPRRS